GYSDTRHKTGSHVDVKGPSLVVGLARAKETANGARLTYGGFLEAGWGSYDSYNSFSGVGEVKGKGDTSYYGIGFLARQDCAKRGTGRIYTEGSLRVGQVKTDFSSADIVPGQTETARYDAKSVYCGLHLGVGWIKELKGGAALDLYSKILYTRTGSDSVNVLGDPVEFDAVTSLRWRAGLRYVKAAGEKSEFYAGLAYDHEFDGKAKGAAGGAAIDVPKLKGATGIGEIGVTFKGKNSIVDIKAEGYAGKREGVGFAAPCTWLF
ncbi:MAG: autotransporter outer membrane beta-barrel domain-containing protein, partial [Acidaminococcales bacterium]|nr:autotransporter outer membrane beta-barrel domain-containing protein [Acidaminococcales bacterium]